MTRDVVLARGTAVRARVFDGARNPLVGAHVNRRGIFACEWIGGDVQLDESTDRTTAITGSNGKTTTTALVADMLKAFYDNKVLICGNDGKPVLERAVKTDYPILLEVSSFQFADIKKSPHISAVLNITPNHLDWHKDLEDYINSKKNLIVHQKEADWDCFSAVK